VSTHASRTKPMLFALVGCLITGAAALVAFEVVHGTLGATGGILAAVVAALLVGGPMAVIGLVIWGPRDPAPPRRPVRTSAPEAGGSVAPRSPARRG